MSFFRPEAVASLKRWGIPGALALVGAGLIWRGGTMLASGAWTGAVLLVLGVFACLSLFGAFERALTAWRARRGGPGVVVIEEGRISYFGPEGGAVLALDLLVSVDIVTTEEGPMSDDLYWILADERGHMAAIPSGAKDSQRLLDVLGSLSGFDHMAVISAMGSTERTRFKIWRRDGAGDLAHLG